MEESDSDECINENQLILPSKKRRVREKEPPDQ
jgi:hypothetical protein